MISIIIPTIRPQNIPLILDAIALAVSVEYEVIWEIDTERIGAPKMLKKLVDKAKGEWIVFLGDDTIPKSNCIDNALNFALMNNYTLVGFNDGHRQKATHWIAHKSLLSHLNGEFFNTQYIHNFCDDELRFKAEKLGLYGWCKNAEIIHNHPAFGAPIDDTYKKQLDKNFWEHDKKLFAERNCKLSVVMIVKNEQEMLETCLESVKNADEIIIVDTGSADKTKEIASKYTDKIYDFEWCDDFSKARNYALSKATGDWVLSIDADEELSSDGINEIKKLLFTHKNAVGIQMKSPSNAYYVPRVFKNIPNIKWRDRYHETINAGDYDKFNTVSITYKTSPAHAKDPKRGLRIMEKVLEEDPLNTRNLYYLGREYGYYKDWDKAKKTLEKYVRLSNYLAEKADAYFILALCYWYDGKGNGEKAREYCFKAISINAHFKAAILLMAHMSFEKNAEQWKKMAHFADNSGTLFARINYLTI